MPPTREELVDRFGPPDDCADPDTGNVLRATWALTALDAFAREPEGSSPMRPLPGDLHDRMAETLNAMDDGKGPAWFERSDR